jgi:hypothetical protein
MSPQDFSTASPETPNSGTSDERQHLQVVLQLDEKGNVVYVDGGKIQDPNTLMAILNEAHNRLLHLYVLQTLPNYMAQLTSEKESATVVDSAPEE